MAGYYVRRAAADVGLILTEGTLVGREGAANDANMPFFHGDQPLQTWGMFASRFIKRAVKLRRKSGIWAWRTKPGTGHFPDAPSDSPLGLTHTGKQVAQWYC